ncbi:MAG: hypothetical protein K2O70_11365 [Desulfovibrionaceae bacterium]|nr:hypothetical protein [Desulfovibrionaceae bacterium]
MKQKIPFAAPHARGKRTNKDTLLKTVAMHTSVAENIFRYFKELYVLYDYSARMRRFSCGSRA